MEHVRAAKRIVIAVTTEARFALQPGVPAVREQVAGYAGPCRIGLFAAKFMASQAVRRILNEHSPLAAPEITICASAWPSGVWNGCWPGRGLWLPGPGKNPAMAAGGRGGRDRA